MHYRPSNGRCQLVETLADPGSLPLAPNPNCHPLRGNMEQTKVTQEDLEDKKPGRTGNPPLRTA